jgi:hypothetical protein
MLSMTSKHFDVRSAFSNSRRGALKNYHDGAPWYTANQGQDANVPFATAIPSRWRSRMIERSNSATPPRTLSIKPVQINCKRLTNLRAGKGGGAAPRRNVV